MSNSSTHHFPCSGASMSSHAAVVVPSTDAALESDSRHRKSCACLAGTVGRLGSYCTQYWVPTVEATVSVEASPPVIVFVWMIAEICYQPAGPSVAMDLAEATQLVA